MPSIHQACITTLEVEKAPEHRALTMLLILGSSRTPSRTSGGKIKRYKVTREEGIKHLHPSRAITLEKPVIVIGSSIMAMLQLSWHSLPFDGSTTVKLSSWGHARPGGLLGECSCYHFQGPGMGPEGGQLAGATSWHAG